MYGTLLRQFFKWEITEPAYRSLARMSVIGSVYGILWTSSPVLNDKNLAEQYGWPALQAKHFTDTANCQQPFGRFLWDTIVYEILCNIL